MIHFILFVCVSEQLRSSFLASDITENVALKILLAPMKTNFPVISVAFTLFSDGWKIENWKIRL